MGKVVTFRFNGCPATEVMIAAIETIRSWPWDGPVEVPARLEYFVSKGGQPCHFPIGDVRWNRDDGDAILLDIDALDAVVCAAPVDVEARKAAAQAAASRRVAERAKAERERDAERAKREEALVKPSMRFLLSPEARKEARSLADRLDYIPGGSPALVSNAERLEVNFPLLAQADELLGGKITQMIRAAGELPIMVKDDSSKWPWVRVARLISNGLPHHLLPHYLDGKRFPGALDDALDSIAVFRRRLNEKAADSAAAKVRSEIEKERRGRPLTEADEVQIEKAGRLAVAALRPVPAGCPF